MSKKIVVFLKQQKEFLVNQLLTIIIKNLNTEYKRGYASGFNAGCNAMIDVLERDYVGTELKKD